jgi:hypothetical protein
MLTKTMKVVSVAGLLLTAALWSYAPSLYLPLRLVAGLTALLVATQAAHARKYCWAAASGVRSGLPSGGFIQ